MELDTTLPESNTYRFKSVNNILIVADMIDHSIYIKKNKDEFKFDFNQIEASEFFIEQDEKPFSHIRKFISHALLCGLSGRMLSRFALGKILKRVILAACQRHIIGKISHKITTTSEPREFELIFVKGPCYSSSRKVGKALLVSGLWLHIFHQIWEHNHHNCG